MTSDSRAAEFAFAPVEAPTLKERIASEIWVSILTGRLEPGARVVESRLARQMKVAQTTVREAIQDLANQGLLVKRVNRETLVRKLTLTELDDLFIVRKNIEGLAVELAHSRLEEGDLAPLYGTIERMRRAAQEKNISGFYYFDIAFHQQLGRLARNEFLQRALVGLSIGPVAFVLAGAPFPLGDNYLQVTDDHVQILDAFKEKTPKGARRIIEGKLQVWHEMQMRCFPDR